jgi:hypothetical protein
MPVTTLASTADGSEALWSLHGGATKWQAVLVPDDGDASAIQIAGLSGTSTQTFVTEDLPAGAVSVNNVTVRHRARRANTISPPSACNGVLKLGADILGPVIGGAYWNRRPETYYLDFLTPDIAKLDASAWTVANVNAAQVGVRLASLNPPNDASETIYVTTLNLDVAWDAAGSGLVTTFASFVGSIIGACIGSAIYGEHIPAIARLVRFRSRSKHCILPSEFRDLLLSLQAPQRVYLA